MTDLTAKIKIQTQARLEKYAPGTPEEDIKSGRAVPVEIVRSEDILLDPDPAVLQRLHEMGIDVPEGV